MCQCQRISFAEGTDREGCHYWLDNFRIFYDFEFEYDRIGLSTLQYEVESANLVASKILFGSRGTNATLSPKLKINELEWRGLAVAAAVIWLSHDTMNIS